MAKHTATAIAEWAETQAKPKNRPDYSRLTQAEIGLLYQLHKEGFTQAEIAQRLGCNQPTVCKWLAQFTDTTSVAKELLRGSALKMARNVVQRGRAADHVEMLGRLGVVPRDGGANQGGISITINGLVLGGMAAGSSSAPLDVVVEAISVPAQAEQAQGLVVSTQPTTANGSESDK